MKTKEENIINALRLINHQLRFKIDNLSFLEKVVGNNLLNLKVQIADKFNDTSSGYWLVFNEKEGEYSEPLIVKASCCEEALCPEDDSYQRHIALAIPHIKNFKEI